MGENVFSFPLKEKKNLRKKLIFQVKLTIGSRNALFSIFDIILCENYLI